MASATANYDASLARNLHTSHARFLFELLQNADDNRFVAVKNRGVDPYVVFSVYQDRIRIECNEDGFTHRDLKAICAIGQSSKNRNSGYIGEKGIGFKYVFMAAYKVNILSKELSFSFTHPKGDSGLGMGEQAPSYITLHLHQYDENNDTSLLKATRQREEIDWEFANLPITVLFFLRNLRRIEIQFHDDDDEETTRVEYSFSGSNSSTLIERDIYIPTTFCHEPQQLLQPISNLIEEVIVPFLHRRYFDCSPETPIGAEQSWSGWLEHFLLSPKLDLVRTYGSECFIGALQHHWTLLNKDDPSSSEFLRSLRTLDITCLDGEDYPLEETTLPLPELTATFPIYNNQGDRRRAALGIAAAENGPMLWKRPDACVWQAPGVPYAYSALEGQVIESFSAGRVDSLRRFMSKTLGIGNCDQNCCIQELRHTKDVNCDVFDRVVEVYGFLKDGDMAEGQLKDVRAHFSTMPLIFVPNGKTSGWRTTAECLWSSGAKIQGRTTLSSIYEDLEDFFVETLGVQRLTLAIACDELLNKANEQPTVTVAEIKETIWLVNTLLHSATSYPDPEQLPDSAIFPVEHPTGQVSLDTSRTEFVIRDRKPLAEMFASKVRVLNFSLDEFHRFGNLFSWLGLDSRYLSSSVKEISTVASDSQIRVQRPDRVSGEEQVESTGKYWLFQLCSIKVWVASHFNSPRVDNTHDLYHALRATEVYETHGISSEVHLAQDGKVHIHVKSSSEFHIRDTAGRLRIYIPLNTERQDFCYHSSLPRRLLEWVMTEPETQICGGIPHRAFSAMSSALNAPIQSVSRILEAEGIIDVGAIEDDQDQEFRGVVDASPPPAEAPQPEGFAVEMPLRPFPLTGSRSISGPPVTRPTFTQQTSTTTSPDSNRSYPLQPDSAVGTAAAPPVSQIFHFGQTPTAPAATTPPIYNAFNAEYFEDTQQCHLRSAK
ncbi:hypothetical protein BDP55DRAFT_721711 [Colletotrichum godetiae]|uniref:Uncharacterized protein n=1 Tax=Colletotrichum godetiae TaxID=1209918 RepID=A0AAJ0EN10_9PEZI|nr:uncharacterized protein BDP55DRAFT_721711 [Colletotrichum godetiae]KAK1657077.1 hypothetical protein BDP55DRAFT_721711 [Colletotrichum godetiae]